MTWFAAIQKAPSCPPWIGTHQSAVFEVRLKSGDITTNFEPLCRASVTKCASGERVMPTFEPIDTMYLE